MVPLCGAALPDDRMARLPAASDADWPTRLAFWIGYVVSPLTAVPVAGGVLLHGLGATPPETIRVAGLLTFWLGLVPLLLLLYLHRRGDVDSLEVRSREHRKMPLTVTLLCAATSALLMPLVVDSEAATVRAFGSALVVLIGVLFVVTLRWKISFHAASVAAAAATSLFAWRHALVPEAASVVWTLLWMILVPVVAWARVRSGAHSWSQVIAGSLIGGLLTYGILWRYSGL